MTESLIDHVTEHPEVLPDGWTMENDDYLQDDQESVGLLALGSDFSPPGSYAIAMEVEGLATEYGSSIDHALMASVWTEHPGLAICLARAASAYSMAEVNPGWEIVIEARPSDNRSSTPTEEI